MSFSKKPKIKKVRHNEYYDVIEKFDELYDDSRNNKTFDNLMDTILSEENIKLAYRNIKRNSGSTTKGTDNLTIKNIEILPENDYVSTIRNKLAWYKPKPVKRVEIPKPDGRKRPLGIPTIWDRLIQQCILQVLEPICEAKFHERSNGFRPNRSAENAIAQCYRMIQIQNLHFAIDIDIKGFFDNVSHSKLIKQMWTMGIRDKKLICIIKEMLKAPIILPDGNIEFPTKGTPQGGILSPLLSNIVLNELDWWISSQWESNPIREKYSSYYNKNGGINYGNGYRMMKKTNLKEMYMVRYADDFKIFCRKRSDANKIYTATKVWLQERLKLQVNDEKSKIINLKNSYSDFLGFKMKANPKNNKYVVKSQLSEKAKKSIISELKEQIKFIQNPKDKNDEAIAINIYNSKVIGIHNYYKIATDISLNCSNIAHQVNLSFSR